MYLVCEDNPKFEETGKLIKAAHEMGMQVNPVSPVAFDGRGKPFVKSHFLYGTRDFVLPRVEREGHIFSKQEYLYDYSFLMAMYSSKISFRERELFNFHSTIMTAAEFRIGTEPLFVRPVSGNKQFAGQVVDWDRDFSCSDSTLAEYLQIPLWELIVVSPAQTRPVAEYRFFVIRDKKDEKIDLVGCQYLPTAATISKNGISSVEIFAVDQAHFLFDKIPFGDSFVMDIALDEEGRYSVIELNSWNSSSFYCIDPKKLLEMVVDYERS